MSELNTVTISTSRYEELIDIETRANVVAERAHQDEYTTVEDILWILGTASAIARANELRRKREGLREKFPKKKNGE